MPAESHTTERLLARARAGDRAALDTLFARELPALRRWARGRLPRGVRDIVDTHDLVQDTLLQTFKRIDAFAPRGPGALQAYLRQAVMNRIRNEFRRAKRTPARDPIDSSTPAQEPTPIEAVIRQEQLDRYEAALQQMTPGDRELIVARLELGLTYEEMAQSLGKPTWNAARMATARALLRLAEALKA